MTTALEICVTGSPSNPSVDVYKAGDQEIENFRYVVETVTRNPGEAYRDFEKRAIARCREVEKERV